CCPQMFGMVLSIGLPFSPWQRAQTWTFPSSGSARSGITANVITAATTLTMPRECLPLIAPPARSPKEAGPQAVPLRQPMMRASPSIEREGDDVVAAAEVDLRVTACADHDVLLAADRIARRRSVDAGSGAEAPQLLAVPGIIGRELAVAFACEYQP